MGNTKSNILKYTQIIIEKVAAWSVHYALNDSPVRFCSQSMLLSRPKAVRRDLYLLAVLRALLHRGRGDSESF